LGYSFDNTHNNFLQEMKSHQFVASLLRQSPLRASAPLEKCVKPRTAAAVACIIRLDTPNLGKMDGSTMKGSNVNEVNLSAINKLLENITLSSSSTPSSSSSSSSLSSKPQEIAASLLFIKRAVRQGDLWSGDVAWPGGQVDIGESDYDAVRRECREEIGINLNNTERYIWLGRGSDLLVYKGKHSMRIIPHIFIDTRSPHASNGADAEDEFVLQEMEVSHAWWVDITQMLSPESHRWRVYSLQRFMEISDYSWWSQKLILGLLRILHISTLKYPATFVGRPDNGFEASSIPEEMFYLWGLTRGLTKSVVMQAFLHDPDPTSASQLIINDKASVDNWLEKNISKAPDPNKVEPRPGDAAFNALYHSKFDNKLFDYHVKFWLLVRSRIAVATNYRCRLPFVVLAVLAVSSYTSMVASVVVVPYSML
jgi:8-oxo-dGTP pyrophosphatase MutT (NUDIX family)